MSTHCAFSQRKKHIMTKSEWGLIALLGTAFLISRYDFALMSLALPDIQKDLGIAEQDLGEFVGYTRLGALAALPLALLADFAGRRRLLLVTLAGFTALYGRPSVRSATRAVHHPSNHGARVYIS